MIHWSVCVIDIVKDLKSQGRASFMPKEVSIQLLFPMGAPLLPPRTASTWAIVVCGASGANFYRIWQILCVPAHQLLSLRFPSFIHNTPDLHVLFLLAYRLRWIAQPARDTITLSDYL